MKQFSTQLHSGNNNFKKQFLRTISLLFFITNIFTQVKASDSIIVAGKQPVVLWTNPAVTINQVATQQDPTSLQPINFTVVFDQPVIGFATGDVVVTGTASGNIVSLIVGGPTTYNVAVSGMTSCGTVIVNIPAGVCANALSEPNLASTSLDNTVTFLAGNPNVSINQAASQSDPTSTSPINFTVLFDQPVTGFATGDVSLSGTAGATTGIVTGSGTTYNVAVSGMTASGTVIATIAAGVCQNTCTQPNNASTGTDNTVTINCVPPVANPVPNQQLCAGSATNAVNFTGTTPGTTFSWTNSTPSIGLAASGTGNIASFTALNNTNAVVTATILVTPWTGTCTGAPISFTITVNPLPSISITPATTCGGVASIFGVALIASAAGPPVPGSVTVNSGTLNLTVPDNTANGLSNNILLTGVPVNATITNVSVTLNMSHTYPGDMIINLKAPNGRILNLYKYGTGLFTGPASGNATWGWYGAKVSQVGTNAWSTLAIAPYTYNNSTAWKADIINTPVAGRVIQNPTGFISNSTSFLQLYTTGASTNGNWTLAMADGGMPGDIGTLASWSLTIDYTAPGSPPHTFVWSPLTGLYNDAVTTAPYTGTNTPIVYAAPTVSTVYTVTGTNPVTGCSATATTQVNYTPPAPVVTPASAIMCLGDPAVKMKVTPGGIPATAATWSPIAGLFSDPSGTIPYVGNAVDSVWARPTPAGIYTYQVVTQSLPSSACTSPPRTVPVAVVNPVTISSHPANQTLCTGSSVAGFTVSVAGSGPVTYQWQLSTNGGVNWNNTPNGGPYSGGNTGTLTIVPVTAGMNGYLYRVLINRGTGCSVTSNAGLLTINPLPTAVITANPLVIGPTQTSTISSTVIANPAATYAWYYNGSVLPGETSATLLVNYGSPGDYQLQVTNICGVGLSNTITIANSFALNMFTYPNPSGGLFQLRYPSEAGNTLQRSLIVYNNRGEKVLTKNFTQTIPYQKIDVDIRAHGNGMYWIELKDGRGNRLAINRVVVQ